jgi:regulator of protease activity HflC (stomatin/prohibitin superfamily)
LREVLTANRAQFADRLKDTLSRYAESNRLGIEVVDVALMGLHPPVEAADAYLDVISARIDAERVQVEALGQKSVQIADVQREIATAIAGSQAEAARRTGTAVSESSEFVAIGQAYAVAPEPFQLRLWFEALEEILEQKRFVLIDQAVNTGPGGILLDHRGRLSTDSDPVPLTRDAGFSNSGSPK